MANASATLEQLVADSNWLHRLAVALVKDEATADDLVQDTYTIAATHPPTDGQPHRPWLARVLLNRVRTARRSARRRSEREQAFGELAASPARPAEIVDRIELQRTLAGFVLGLAAPQRDVVLLHYFEGLTSKEIGLRLGISAGTVRWRLKQAIDELRERLEQRSPNRAWVPALAAFTRTAPRVPMALLPKLLFAAFVLLTIFGFLLRAQLGTSQSAETRGRHARHASNRAPTSTMMGDTSTSAPLSSGLAFGAEHRRLEGRVIDGNGHGVDGADVQLECGYEDGGKQKQVSGAGGAFAFEIDPHCRYLITATKGDSAGQQSWLGPATIGVLAPARFEHEAADSERDEIAEHMREFDADWFRTVVQLRRLSQSVIRVIDADTGAPIGNAKVSTGWIYDDGVSVVTDAGGIARVKVPLPANITVQADQYVTAREMLDNPSSPGCPKEAKARTSVGLGLDPKCDVPSQVTLEARLNRGISVSGTIIGPDGNAVASASVVISGPASGPPPSEVSANTDASGKFEAKVSVAGRYGVTAERRDMTNEGPVAVDVPAQGRTDLIARVVPRAAIRGTVVDLSSKPVAGARVSLADGTVPPVITDANGRFTIENVAGVVDIIANRGSDASAFLHLQLKPGERQDVTLQLGPSGISGVAVEHDGSPFEGAELWLNMCCESNPNLVPGKRITTDSTGRFAFDTPRGDFVISVKRNEVDDYEDEDDMRVTGGSHDVRLVVP
jgi:RNA polymerase sigma-70 factor (ECF subfamily)